MERAPHHRHFSGSRVSLGSIKYAVGAVATSLLAEKIKSPEERYLVLACVGATIGAIATAWRDHVRAKRICEERREIV